MNLVIDCGDLSNPINGQVVLQLTTKGGMATYSCNNGYRLSGSPTRTCGSDGAWIGVVPTCISKCRLDLQRTNPFYC